MLQITPEQQQKLNEIGQKYNLALILAYGSQVKGQPRPDSDLDIAVLDQQKTDYERFGTLFSEISDVFRGKNVDLRFLNEADYFYLDQVMKNSQLLFGDLSFYHQSVIYAHKLYLDDAKKLAKLRDRAIEVQLTKLMAAS